MENKSFSDLKEKTIREMNTSGSPLLRSNRFILEKDNNNEPPQKRAASPVLKVNFFSPLDAGVAYVPREKGKRSPRSNSPFYLNTNKDRFTLPSIKLVQEENNNISENPYKNGLRIIPAADMFSRKKKKSPEPLEEKVTRKVLMKRFFSPTMYRATIEDASQKKSSKSPPRDIALTFKDEIKGKLNKTIFWTREIIQEKTLVFGESYNTFASLVNIIFKRAMSDPDLSCFFDRKNIQNIKQRFAELIVNQFNKNYKYEGRDLIEVHKKLNLRRKHFLRMKNIIAFSMVELHYSYEAINAAYKLFDSFQEKIICSENLYELLMEKNLLVGLQENFVEMLMNDPLFITLFRDHYDFWKIKHHTFLVKLALDNTFFINNENLRRIHVEALRKFNFNHIHFYRIKHIMGKCLLKMGFDPIKAEECVDRIEEKRKAVLNQRSILEKLQDAKLFDVFLKNFCTKLIADKVCSALFVEFNEDRLKLHHKAFLQFVLGSPNPDAKQDIYNYHKGNKKSSRTIFIATHFQAVKKALESLLKEYSDTYGIISEGEIKEVLEELEMYRNDICVVEESIFTKIGGEEVLIELTDRLYKKVLRAERISHFFSKTYINVITAQMKKFLEFAFGGPCYYRLEDLRSAHENLMITNEEFEIFVSIIDTSLVEMNILKKIRDEALERIARYKSYICHEGQK